MHSSANTTTGELATNDGKALSAVAFSCFGWAFDLFDLFILLYVAPVLAKVFFPSTSPMLSLTGVYAAFTATLLMRPVGAIIFGPYADRRGRRKAMIIAAIGVGLATAAMGALPTIEQIGIAAPLLFIALRLTQGIFMGGMVASTHTIGTESISPRWRGLTSGIITGGGSGLGKLLASAIFLLTSWCFPGAAFEAWGWRFMFFSGLLSSALGLLIFLKLHESPMWEGQRLLDETQKRSSAPSAPLKTLLRGGFLGTVAASVVLTFAGGGMSYLTSGYLPVFLRIVNGIPRTTVASILLLSALSVIISSVLAGLLTDLIGRKKAIVIYGVCSTLILPSMYLVLGHVSSILVAAAITIVLSGVGTFCYAPLLIILNERFPTRLRSTGTSVSWNVGFSAGGALPVLVSFLSKQALDLPSILAVTTCLIGLIYLITASLSQETGGEMN
ncbi:MAG: MFS transporter [Acidihalobacter sp.]|uniref:MFS transporter n=1 Tax=Acidihalobacter sp. TaxID=1872108 RepID=UPI00307F4AE0